jgi:hypothetical protein
MEFGVFQEEELSRSLHAERMTHDEARMTGQMLNALPKVERSGFDL